MTAPATPVLTPAALIRAARAVDHKMGWRRELDLLIRTYIDRKADGRPLSSRTRAEHFEVLFHLFELLHSVGMKVRPGNLGGRHIDFLRGHYRERLRAGTIQPSTLHSYFAVLRRFCNEIGKSGLVPSMDRLFPEDDVARRYSASRDKSWDGAGVDFNEVFVRAAAVEPFVAMALLAQVSFGLRRQEALCLRPLPPQQGQVATVEIIRGAKGGRMRTVAIETQAQRQALEHIAQYVFERDGAWGGTIGPRGAGYSLHSNRERYAKVVQRLGINSAEAGVTGHGLRAQWAIDFLERRGHVPAVRTPDGKPVELTPAQRERELADRAALALQTGHSRVSVSNAYVGGLPRKRRGEIAGVSDREPVDGDAPDGTP